MREKLSADQETMQTVRNKLAHEAAPEMVVDCIKAMSDGELKHECISLLELVCPETADEFPF